MKAAGLDKNKSLDELCKIDKQSFKNKPQKKFGGKTLGKKKIVHKGKPHQKDQKFKKNHQQKQDLKPRRQMIRKESGGPRPNRPNNKPQSKRPHEKVNPEQKRPKNLNRDDDKPKRREPIRLTKTESQIRFSATRLKVRNIDNQKVTNEEIRVSTIIFHVQKLFEGIGELTICRFDYSDFGQFLGSATVQYKKPEHAKKAIAEYNEGELDGKLLTVEPDILKDGYDRDHGDSKD